LGRTKDISLLSYIFQAVLLALETLAKITSYQIDSSAITEASDKTVTNGMPSGDHLTKTAQKSMVTAVTACANNDTSSETVMNKYFTEFMECLINIFKKDRKMLDKRGAFIIR